MKKRLFDFDKFISECEPEYKVMGIMVKDYRDENGGLFTVPLKEPKSMYQKLLCANTTPNMLEDYGVDVDVKYEMENNKNDI